MRSLLNNLILILTVFSFGACTEIFEEQIDDEMVFLISPSDFSNVENYNITFKWEPVEAALQYRVQIVSPKFDDIDNFVVDTIITSTTFNYTLSPDSFQWRVRGENGSSETPYSVRTLIIDSADFSEQKVILNTPEDDFLSNNSTIAFTWQALPGATSYILEVDELTGNFSAPLVLQTTVSGSTTEYFYDVPVDGEYIWRVKALSGTEESGYSDVRQFTVDETGPTVSLISPAHGSSIIRPLTIIWESPDSDVKEYQLYAYRIIGADSTSNVLSGYGPKVETSPFSTFGNTVGSVNDKIAWRVRCVDQAGNVGPFSTLKSFTIGQ